jgi:hypothetical protein
VSDARASRSCAGLVELGLRVCWPPACAPVAPGAAGRRTLAIASCTTSPAALGWQRHDRAVAARSPGLSRAVARRPSPSAAAALSSGCGSSGGRALAGPSCCRRRRALATPSSGTGGAWPRRRPAVAHGRHAVVSSPGHRAGAAARSPGLSRSNIVVRSPRLDCLKMSRPGRAYPQVPRRGACRSWRATPRPEHRSRRVGLRRPPANCLGAVGKILGGVGGTRDRVLSCSRSCCVCSARLTTSMCVRPRADRRGAAHVAGGAV